MDILVSTQTTIYGILSIIDNLVSIETIIYGILLIMDILVSTETIYGILSIMAILVSTQIYGILSTLLYIRYSAATSISKHEMDIQSEPTWVRNPE